MYCPVCLQHTIQVKPVGVIKMTFDGKSLNNSLFTYNLQKETVEQLNAKLREKVREYLSFYSEFKNKSEIKRIDIFSSDFVCLNSCKLSPQTTKFSVTGCVFSPEDVKKVLSEESAKLKLKVNLSID